MPGKKGGGIDHHKPDCACIPCLRKKKTLSLRIGVSPVPGPADENRSAAPVALAKGPTDVIEADILEVPGKGIRDRIAQWMLLRHQDPGITNAEAARQMGIAACTLNSYISKARKEGWLTFSDPLSRIEHEIIPQTLDNLAFYLSKEGGRDKQVTIETAKGTIFRQFQDSKGISDAPTTVLALKIETAPVGADPLKITAGTVVGKPRIIEVTPLPNEVEHE